MSAAEASEETISAGGPHYRTLAERKADGWVHAIGIVLASVAAVVLLGLSLRQGGFDLASVVFVYAVCMIVMLACSAAYNLALGTRQRALLRRFDHAAIFLMIAGTYTPFTILRLEGAWAVGMTAAVWIIALIGVFGKLFLPGISKRLWIPVYVLLGWMVVIAARPLSENLSPAGIALLVIGGAIYTLGVGVYVVERIPYRRAIWHGFVLAAAGAHYAAVLISIVLTPSGT